MILGYNEWKRLNESKSLVGSHYVVYEGQLWNGETGELVLLEDWSVSDILHTVADVASMAADYVIPGSGAVIDVLNGISYIVEAQFKPEEEKDTLYMMAAITFAFVAMPGPLQMVSTPLKSFVKGTTKVASSAVKSALKVVASILDKVLLGIPSLIKKALLTPLGKKIAGKYGEMIVPAINNFTKRVKGLFNKMLGKTEKEAAETATGTSVKATAKEVSAGLAQRAALTLQKLTPNSIKRLNALAIVPTLKFGGKSPSKIAAKLGIKPGKIYRYVNDQGKISSVFIKSIGEDGKVIALFGPDGAKNALKLQSAVNLENLLNRVIVAPWLRRGSSVTVPFFIKRFAAMFMEDGSLDPNLNLDELTDLSSDEVSEWMAANWKQDDVAYQGGTGKYTVSDKVTAIQNALIALGHDLPRFGADGKFGAETLSALNQYETKKGLPASTTSINAKTAETIVKDLQASEDSNKLALATSIMQSEPRA